MQIKSIPKRWNGQAVVAFVTQPTGTTQFPYRGVAVLESRSDVYTVLRLESDSISASPWQEIPGSAAHELTWSQAQSVLQTKIQGPH